MLSVMSRERSVDRSDERVSILLKRLDNPGVSQDSFCETPDYSLGWSGPNVAIRSDSSDNHSSNASAKSEWSPAGLHFSTAETVGEQW